MEGYGKPLNPELYEKVKKFIYSKMPIHSLYRSAHIHKLYKRLGGKFDETSESGIKRWFREDWINLNDYLRGKKTKCGVGDTMKQYGEYKLCRPYKIAQQLTPKQIEMLIKEKTKIGKKPLYTYKVLGTKEFNIKKIGKNI